MKRSEILYQMVPKTVSILFIVLFAYAATSKLLDFDQFKIQLGQSPIMTSYADWVAWGVPSMEFLLAVALAINRFRTIALYASLGLMVSFSMYIFAIQNFSDFIPCSCGGILERMGWTEHLVFNLFFVVLAGIAIILKSRDHEETPNRYQGANRAGTNNATPKKRALAQILLVISLSGGSVLGLFFLTDHKNHLPGSFIRLFPPHVISGAQKELRLLEDQYQFAGLTKKHIYLYQKGNPLSLLEIDDNFLRTDTITLSVPDTIPLNLQNTKITINDLGIFMTDGSIPMLLTGETKSHGLKAIPLGNNHFNEAIPIAPNKLAVVKLIPKTGRRLGLLNIDSLTTAPNPKALEKQVDGFFCTSGMLRYNQQTQELIYTYYYRNQYIVMDRDLRVRGRFRTLDTTTTAKIKIRETTGTGGRSMATPPPFVNRRSCPQNNWLFIQSVTRAKNESQERFEQGNVIDVYNLLTGSYKLSFYIPKIDGRPLNDYRIINNKLLVLYTDRLITYGLGKNYLGDI